MPGSVPTPAPPDTALTICPYCRVIVGAPPSFSWWWHVGRDPDTPSCCLTEQYQRRNAGAQQAPAAPASSGPIAVAGRSGGGETSPLILVDESRP